MNRERDFVFTEGAEIAGFTFHALTPPRLSVLFRRKNLIFSADDADALSWHDKQFALSELALVLSSSDRELAKLNRLEDDQWAEEVDVFRFREFADEGRLEAMSEAINQEMRAWAAKGMEQDNTAEEDAPGKPEPAQAGLQPSEPVH